MYFTASTYECVEHYSYSLEPPFCACIELFIFTAVSSKLYDAACELQLLCEVYLGVFTLSCHVYRFP